MARKTIQVKTFVDQETYDKLVALGGRLDDSMSSIIREGVHWRYRMQIEGVPTCASGRACFVAAMHFQQTEHATPISHVGPLEAARLVAPPLPAAV
jgi:hypothetical protein